MFIDELRSLQRPRIVPLMRRPHDQTTLQEVVGDFIGTAIVLGRVEGFRDLQYGPVIGFQIDVIRFLDVLEEQHILDLR